MQWTDNTTLPSRGLAHPRVGPEILLQIDGGGAVDFFKTRPPSGARRPSSFANVAKFRGQLVCSIEQARADLRIITSRANAGGAHSCSGACPAKRRLVPLAIGESRRGSDFVGFVLR